MAVVQFERALHKIGAESYDPHGDAFDPNRHEAVAVADRDAAPDTVVEVLSRGWSVDGVVVRAAKVIVQAAG
jgi:molecular chaperone GrpE